MGERTTIITAAVFVVAMIYGLLWIIHRYEKPMDRMLSAWWGFPTAFFLFIGSICAGIAIIGSLA